MSEESEYYQISHDVDRGDGSKLAALIAERDELKADIVRLKTMITEYAEALARG